jgi:hypothetical protein
VLGAELTTKKQLVTVNRIKPLKKHPASQSKPLTISTDQHKFTLSRSTGKMGSFQVLIALLPNPLGVPPAGGRIFFASPKESSQRKGDPRLRGRLRRLLDAPHGSPKASSI